MTPPDGVRMFDYYRVRVVYDGINWLSPIIFLWWPTVVQQPMIFAASNHIICRSQWPCGLRRGSSAARLLGSWVRIPPGAWMSVSCEWCALSGRGLCDELITRPEESYRLWCVLNVCDHETSKWGGPGPCRAVEPYKKKYILMLNKKGWLITSKTPNKFAEKQCSDLVQ
jgi:hypothetical protein